MRQTVIRVFLCLVIASNAAWGRENTSTPDATAFVTCWNKAFKDYHTRTALSADYVAPDGHSRAYASVRAKAVGGNSEDQQCENKSSLFVSDGTKSQTVLTQSASDKAGQGNGIQIIDWSADSKQLLADATTWHYYSEDMKHHVIVYDMSKGTLQNLDLDKLFSEHAKQGCEIDGRILGFGSDGDVVLEVWPIDEVYGAPSCVKQRSIWQLRPSSRQLVLHPADFRSKRNSVTERPLRSMPRQR